MNFLYTILIVVYILLIIYTVILILLDTETTPKALGYLLLVLLVPVVGVAIYFAFGLNFRHLSSRNRMVRNEEELDVEVRKHVFRDTNTAPVYDTPKIENFSSVVKFLKGLSDQPLCESFFTLLINGEEKFPEVLRVLDTAKHFIHMEYYAWENDTRGNQI